MADNYQWWYDRLAPSLLAALVLMGAHEGQQPLVALAATLLFTLLLTRYWSRHSLDALRYEREVGDNRAFAGDELSMVLRLSNDKLLPLPWIEIDDTVPEQLPLAQPQEGGAARNQGGRLRLAGSISWKERVAWRYRLRCLRRGIYSLGPATVTSGDLFGLFPRSSSLGEVERLVVYPRLIPVDRLDLPHGFPLGDTRSRRWIFEDPSRTVGVRDYRRDDPFRRVHWKATARRQQLQVKIHEPTTTLEVALFLGLDTFTAHHSPQDFEHAVSTVASLAHLLIGQRYPVGLYVNGGTPDSKDVVELAPGASQGQLISILELLAGVEPMPSLPTERLLSQVVPRLPWGSSVIVVVGSASAELLTALQALAQQGQKPAVLSIGSKQL